MCTHIAIEHQDLLHIIVLGLMPTDSRDQYFHSKQGSIGVFINQSPLRFLDVASDAVPLRQREAGPEGPPGHGQGEAARLPLRGTGPQLAPVGGQPRAVRDPRAVQEKPLPLD